MPIPARLLLIHSLLIAPKNCRGAKNTLDEFESMNGMKKMEDLIGRKLGKVLQKATYDPYLPNAAVMPNNFGTIHK